MDWETQDILTVRAIHQLTNLHIWVAVTSSLSGAPVSSKAGWSLPCSDADLDPVFKISAWKHGNGLLQTLLQGANGTPPGFPVWKWPLQAEQMPTSYRRKG
jgi:hypothetical protein